MEPYECRVLADSVYQRGVGLGPRLTTLLVCFPRFILAEFNTHRVFSRNSASSRAVPVSKRIAAVRANPFVPEAFGRNKAGMQAGEDLDAAATALARGQWLSAAEDACTRAEKLSLAGVHKQHVNRLLEPFLFHEVVVTATEWDNFWHLRVSSLAQPEMRRTAEAMLSAYRGSSPELLFSGEWHLPFITEEERSAATVGRSSDAWMELAKLSVARCARVSYLTHDGRRAPEEDLRLHDQLLSAGHLSPFEHAARPFTAAEQRTGADFEGNLRGWVQYRKTIRGEADLLRQKEW